MGTTVTNRKKARMDRQNWVQLLASKSTKVEYVQLRSIAELPGIQYHTAGLKGSPILHAYFLPLCVHLMTLMFLPAAYVCVDSQ